MAGAQPTIHVLNTLVGATVKLVCIISLTERDETRHWRYNGNLTHQPLTNLNGVYHSLIEDWPKPTDDIRNFKTPSPDFRGKFSVTDIFNLTLVNVDKSMSGWYWCDHSTHEGMIPDSQITFLNVSDPQVSNVLSASIPMDTDPDYKPSVHSEHPTYQPLHGESSSSNIIIIVAVIIAVVVLIVIFVLYHRLRRGRGSSERRVSVTDKEAGQPLTDGGGEGVEDNEENTHQESETEKTEKNTHQESETEKNEENTHQESKTEDNEENTRQESKTESKKELTAMKKLISRKLERADKAEKSTLMQLQILNHIFHVLKFSKLEDGPSTQQDSEYEDLSANEAFANYTIELYKKIKELNEDMADTLKLKFFSARADLDECNRLNRSDSYIEHDENSSPSFPPLDSLGNPKGNFLTGTWIASSASFEKLLKTEFEKRTKSSSDALDTKIYDILLTIQDGTTDIANAEKFKSSPPRAIFRKDSTVKEDTSGSTSSEEEELRAGEICRSINKFKISQRDKELTHLRILIDIVYALTPQRNYVGVQESSSSSDDQDSVDDTQQELLQEDCPDS